MEAYVMLIRNVNTDMDRVCVLQHVSSTHVNGMTHNGEWQLSGPGIQTKFYTLQQAFIDINRWNTIVWSREV